MNTALSTFTSAAAFESNPLPQTSQSQTNQSQINQPQTIVLQPSGALNHESSPAFQRSLAESLELAAESVIVDLLWVDAADAAGVAALVAGIETAAGLGKMISFQAMDKRTRILMEAEWERQRQMRLGDWNEVIQVDLERFLENVNLAGSA